MAERVEVYKPLWGVGPVSLRDLSVEDGPTYHIGNTSELKIAHDENVTDLPDFDNVGGGTHAEVRRINSIEGSFIMHDLNADNIALAIRGTRTSVESGTVTESPRKAYTGSLIRLEHPGATSVVVTSSDGNTTYDDVAVSGAGVTVTPGGDLATVIDALPGPSVGLPVLISYAYGAFDEVQALTEAGKNWGLVFDGMNEADSGKPVILDVWKMSLGVLSELSLKGDAMGSMPISGKFLRDPTKGTGQSAYYRVQQM